MLKIVVLTCIILQVSRGINISPYVERQIGRDIRHCLPYLDCPPGHEIIPCDTPFRKEFCVPCKPGMVQPLLVSSNDNLESTKCFRNRNPDECRAEEVRPSRKLISSTCGFNNYCECNMDQCYFGNPCLCGRRTTPCRVNETMNSSGECVKCPPGTDKKDVGCGPCYHINVSKSSKPIPNPAPSMPVATYTTSSTTTSFNNSQSNLRTETAAEEDTTTFTKEDLTYSSEVHKTNSEQTGQSGSSVVLTGIMIILAVLVLLVGTLLVCLIKMRKTKSVDTANSEVNKLIRNQINIVDEEGRGQPCAVHAGFVQTEGNCSHDNNCRSTWDNALRLNSFENNTGKPLTFYHVENSTDLPSVITEIMDTCSMEGECSSKLDDSNIEKNGVTKKLVRHQDSTASDNFQEIRRKDQNNTSDAQKSDLSKERGIVGNCKTSLAYLPVSVRSITHLTDHNLSPVTQVSDEGPIRGNRDTDESLSSCLEYHNCTVRGDTHTVRGEPK